MWAYATTPTAVSPIAIIVVTVPPNAIESSVVAGEVLAGHHRTNGHHPRRQWWLILLFLVCIRSSVTTSQHTMSEYPSHFMPTRRNRQRSLHLPQSAEPISTSTQDALSHFPWEPWRWDAVKRRLNQSSPTSPSPLLRPQPLTPPQDSALPAKPHRLPPRYCTQHCAHGIVKNHWLREIVAAVVGDVLDRYHHSPTGGAAISRGKA